MVDTGYPAGVSFWLIVVVAIALIACIGLLVFAVITKDNEEKKRMRNYFAILVIVLLVVAASMVVIGALTGAARPDSRPDSVAIPAPEASFTANPDAGLAPLTVEFQGTSSGSVEQTWNFGDGSPPETLNTSVNLNVSHTYTQPGYYLVELTATNTGGKSVKAGTIVVSSPPPVPKFNWTALPEDPLTIRFEDATSSSAPVILRIWKFGDAAGSVSFEKNPTHTYTARGKPNVELTVVDRTGRMSTKSQKILVNELCNISPTYKSYAGVWVNISPTTSITTLEMTIAKSAILVHASQGSSPELSDWGSAPLCPYNREWLIAEYPGYRFLFMKLGDYNQLNVVQMVGGKRTMVNLTMIG
jgi:PKD repeat protein